MTETLIHPTAIIDDGALLGKGVRIWHWSHVCASAQIGNYTSLGQNVYIGNQVYIGSGVKIQNNVSVYDCVRLEDHVFGAGIQVQNEHVELVRMHGEFKGIDRLLIGRRGLSRPPLSRPGRKPMHSNS